MWQWLFRQSPIWKIIAIRYRQLHSFVVKTVSGAIVHITDALAKPILKCEVTLEPIQDLHGQDAPYPAGGGKNKFSSEISTNYTLNSDGTSLVYDDRCAALEFIKIDPSTEYTLSYDPAKTDTQNGVFFYSSNNESSFISFLAWGNKPRTFTTPSTANYVRFSFSRNTELTSVQLELGSSATSYSPYSNICPIIGHTGCEVYRTGKNLSSVTTNSNNPMAFWGGDFTELKAVLNSLPVGTYTISNKYSVVTMPDNGKVSYGCFYITAMVNGSQTALTRYSISDDNDPSVGKVYQVSGTFTITEANKGNINHCYVYCDQKDTHSGTGRGTYNCYDIQIESGSTASSYEPYSGTAYPISWQTEAGTVYGAEIDVTGGKLKVAMVEVDLGSLTWTYSSSYGLMTSYISAAKITNNAKGLPCVCSEYASTYGGTWAGWGNFPNNRISCGNNYSGGSVNICVKDSNYNDAAAFKAAMDGVQLVYELATPIEYTLTPTQITALFGKNNIWSSGSEVEVQYKASAS